MAYHIWTLRIFTQFFHCLEGFSQIDGEKADPQCGFNTLEYPAGSGTPLYQILEILNQMTNVPWMWWFKSSLEEFLSRQEVQFFIQKQQHC